MSINNRLISTASAGIPCPDFAGGLAYEAQNSPTTTQTKGLTWNSDGTILLSRQVSQYTQYSAGSPFNISSLTYLRTKALSVGISAHGVQFNPNGTRLFVAGGASQALQFNLSTPYDITTALFGVGASLPSFSRENRAMKLSSDGTLLFVSSSDGNLYKYSLSGAFNLNSTLTYISKSLLYIGEQDFLISSDGTKLIWRAYGTTLQQKTYSVPFDFNSSSTLTYADSVIPGKSSNTISALSFNNDESKIYEGWYNNTVIGQFGMTCSI